MAYKSGVAKKLIVETKNTKSQSQQNYNIVLDVRSDIENKNYKNIEIRCADCANRWEGIAFLQRPLADLCDLCLQYFQRK
jgi:hypothetical protein